MASFYVSRRTGSTQWLLQRVSAALLVVLAFGHFALQHFTSDAVSTGLTVAHRLNDPWWQSYYVVFIGLALFHGTNGLIGILRDYAPPAKLRFLAEIVIWTAVAAFGGRAVINIATPIPETEVKMMYASRGFPAGETRGNPPTLAMTFDFRDQVRELRLFEYYLVQHTHRTEAMPVVQVFGHKPGEEATEANLSVVSAAFDAWVESTIAARGTTALNPDRSKIFSTSYEFAVWARDVRRANAAGRAGAVPPQPTYAATLH